MLSTWYVAYGNFKDLPRKTASNKTLRDKAFNIDKSPKYNGYQRGLASMGRNCFDKKFSGSDTLGGAVKTNVKPTSRRITQTNY